MLDSLLDLLIEMWFLRLQHDSDSKILFDDVGWRPPPHRGYDQIVAVAVIVF